MKTGAYINRSGVLFIVSKYFNKYIVETQKGFHVTVRKSLLTALEFKYVEFLGEL